jgi:hypothetical protein
MMQYAGLPPSASMGVEGSGAAAGSSKLAERKKSDMKESIDVRGRFLYEYVALTFFLGRCWMGCSFTSLIYRLMPVATVSHKRAQNVSPEQL